LARIVQGLLLYWREGTLDMPMRGELPTIRARTHAQASPVATGWSWFVAVISDPELHTIVAFSMIGILVMLNVALRFPEFGQTFAELAQFP
jgi:hypothetical protein